MKIHRLLNAALISAGLITASTIVAAQTLEKIAASNKITVSYREAAVPFSYLPGTAKPVGFAVDITEAIIDDVRQTLNRPALEVAYLPVGAQNRIPLLVNGSYDLECGSTTNTAAIRTRYSHRATTALGWSMAERAWKSSPKPLGCGWITCRANIRPFPGSCWLSWNAFHPPAIPRSGTG